LADYSSGNVSITAYGKGSVYVPNNTISDNSNTSDSGFKAGGLYLGGAEYVAVYNNIVWGNTSASGPDDAYLSGGIATKDGFNNNYEDLSGSWTNFANNVNVVPQFYYPDLNDYRLYSSSPCIDTGDNNASHLSSTDLAKAPRILDGDDDGIATVDMRPYEHVPAEGCEGDFHCDGDVDGSDSAIHAGLGVPDLMVFAANFGRADCPDDCL